MFGTRLRRLREASCVRAAELGLPVGGGVGVEPEPGGPAAAVLFPTRTPTPGAFAAGEPDRIVPFDCGPEKSGMSSEIVTLGSSRNTS